LSDELDARDGVTEDGVLVVQVRRRALGDEPLRAVRVRSGVRHREDARPAVTKLRMEFVLEAIARVAATGARRVAALDHEIRDDAVEDRSAVERHDLLRLTRARIGPFLGSRREA